MQTNGIKRKSELLSIIFLVLFILFNCSPCFGRLINMRFLNSRRKKIRLENRKKIIYWKTTDKTLLDKNIVASTKEVALVTRAYLEHHRVFKDGRSLKRAKEGLHFLYYMQDKNGCFHSYLSKDGKYVEESDDVLLSLGEPTANAFLTISKAASIFKKKDSREYRRIESSFYKVINNIREYWENSENTPGTYKKFEEIKIPAWLLLGRGDLSSLYLLGAENYYLVSPSSKIEEVAKNLGEAISKFKCSKPDDFPLHAHLSFTKNPHIWKVAGAYQTAALAKGGKVFNKRLWLKEAENAAIGFLVHLPVSYGPIQGYYPHPNLYPQTPEAAYSLTLNFSTLAKATQDEKYEKIAGLCAGWFLKNNTLKTPIYSKSSGACYKELRKDEIIKDKSLKASTYALLSFMEVYSKSKPSYLCYYPVDKHTYRILESENSIPVHNDFEVVEWKYPYGDSGKVVVIRRLNTYWHKLTITNDDSYFLLMSFQRQKFFSSAIAVNVRVDGGPILLIPLGGAEGEPYMVMKKVTEPVGMAPGYHTVGVRYKGMLYTKPAIIDCIILQPTQEYLHLVNDKGKHILLMKNWRKKKKRAPIPKILMNPNIVSQCKSIRGKNCNEPYNFHKGKKYFLMPEEGFGIFEW